MCGVKAKSEINIYVRYVVFDESNGNSVRDNVANEDAIVFVIPCAPCDTSIFQHFDYEK